jgi:hypothetical protein
MGGHGQNLGLDQNGYSSSLLEGYDEPEILPSSTRPICLMGADVGQPQNRINNSNWLTKWRLTSPRDLDLTHAAAHMLRIETSDGPRCKSHLIAGDDHNAIEIESNG